MSAGETRTRSCVVTGATGFLGTNLIEALVADGNWNVTASRRHGSETEYLDAFDVEVAVADITDRSDVDRLVAGTDVVFHVAGDTSFWKRNNARQRRTNVDGSMNVALSSLRHDVERMVHVSTIDVLGHDPSRELITEATGRYNFDGLGYHYGDTKFEAEQRLREVHEFNDLDVVVAYPGFMCGPYDHTLQLGSMFFALRDGDLPGLPAGGSSFCHVADVARGLISAATHGRSGEGYALAGHNMASTEWFGHMAGAIGADAPKRTIPEWALVAYAAALEGASRLTKKPPELNPGMARYLSRFQYIDSSKAVDELGYEISPIDTILGDALDWYRANGYDI